MIIAFLSSLNLPSQPLLSLGEEPFVDGRVPLVAGMMTSRIQNSSRIGRHNPDDRVMKLFKSSSLLSWYFEIMSEKSV